MAAEGSDTEGWEAEGLAAAVRAAGAWAAAEGLGGGAGSEIKTRRQPAAAA